MSCILVSYVLSCVVDVMIDCSLLCIIRESVDSLCRDGADAQYIAMQYWSKSRIISPQIHKSIFKRLAFLFECLLISKAHLSAQKPRGRQLNTKVCGCKSAIFCFFLFNNRNWGLVQVLTVVLARNCLLSQGADPRTLSVFITSNEPKSSSSSTLQQLLARCIRTRLVPRPQIAALGLRMRLAHAISASTS